MRIPNAKTAREWEAAGKPFEPDAHFTVDQRDREELRFVNNLIF